MKNKKTTWMRPSAKGSRSAEMLSRKNQAYNLAASLAENKTFNKQYYEGVSPFVPVLPTRKETIRVWTNYPPAQKAEDTEETQEKEDE